MLWITAKAISLILWCLTYASTLSFPGDLFYLLIPICRFSFILLALWPSLLCLPKPDSEVTHPHFHLVHFLHLLLLTTSLNLRFKTRFKHSHFYLPSCLGSLVLWSVAWISFILWLISTYKWVHTMHILLGLGYLTQDDVLRYIHVPAKFMMPLLLITELNSIR
jgi:hypothetical protein